VPTLDKHRRDACATTAVFYVAPAPRQRQNRRGRRFYISIITTPSFSPGGRTFAGLAGKPPRKEDPYMAKKSTSKKPISIRYTCAPNGDQVGLSHYLMAEAKKAK